jgi:hypothetical protein
VIKPHSFILPLKTIRDGDKLLDEIWVMFGNVIMAISAVALMISQNGGCSFDDTDACFAQWPAQGMTHAVYIYYNAEIAWYLHLLLKPVLGYGQGEGRDMIIHHFAALATLLVSYAVHFNRIGILILAVFNLSNPFLHLAKTCNQLEVEALRVPAFAFFAATFFVSRIVMVPLLILWPGVVGIMSVVSPAVLQLPAFWGIYGVLNSLMAVLYILQLVWMRSIFRLLRAAVQHGGVVASKMSVKVDPTNASHVAKRE